MQDPISNLLSAIKNAHARNKEELSINSSKKLISILQVLTEEGYIQSYEVSEGIKPIVTIKLKYYEGKPVIKELKRVSRPGLREYVNHKDIPQVKGGLGVAIISTSKGLLTDAKAREAGLGGEVICSVF
tara:strand:- start:717 stop:1103 length:387 start_codon:yes stop_codon:yes gene_type:complete